MSSEIDALMDLDPLSLSSRQIDEVVAFHRKARENHEAGVKPKRGGGEKVEIDLVKLGLVKAPEPIKRRV